MIGSDASNRLYATGWRTEVMPLGGPRIMCDYPEQGVYATITEDTSSGVYSWAAYSWGSGHYLQGGVSKDAELAAAKAHNWIMEDWS